MSLGVLVEEFLDFHVLHLKPSRMKVVDACMDGCCMCREGEGQERIHSSPCRCYCLHTETALEGRRTSRKTRDVLLYVFVADFDYLIIVSLQELEMGKKWYETSEGHKQK